MLKWAIGGLFVPGLATGVHLSTQIRSVESGLRGEIAENREDIAENRAAIAGLPNSLARIEAIVDERLPRDR